MDHKTVDVIDENCGVCGELHPYTSCPVISIFQTVPDAVVPPKAYLTLPSILRVEKMSDETCTIVAMELIKAGTLFGPLDAPKSLTISPVIQFPLKLFTKSNSADLDNYCLDTSNHQLCNWMCLVVPANNYMEQNLICFQAKSSIYFLSTRNIAKGDQLRVWYSSYYASKMNCALLNENNDNSEDASGKTDVVDLTSLIKKQQNILDRKTWTCKFCSKLENDVSEFAIHILVHYKNTIKKQCDLCGHTYSKVKHLNKHLNEVHLRMKTNENPSSVEETLETRDFKEHIVGDPLLDNILNDSQDNMNPLNEFDVNLSQNITQQLENDNLLSVDSVLQGNDESMNDFNFDLIECQEQLVCDICLKSFKRLPNLMQHLQHHVGRFVCHYCHKVYSRNENLRYHKCLVNIKTPIHKCCYCDKSFLCKKFLVRHMKQAHQKKKTKAQTADPPIKCHTCSVCERNFARKEYLQKHSKIHKKTPTNMSNRKKYICEICAHSFVTQTGLKTHMESHGAPKFHCQICGKKFARQSCYRKHQILHGEAAFACQYCDKKFKTFSYLKGHAKIHTGEKAYNCPECPMKFTQRTHMVRHTNRKHKKSCSVCKLTFPSVAEVKQHQIMHLERYYKCPVCDQVFLHKGSLVRHIKSLHTDKFDQIDVQKIESSNSSATDTDIESVLNSYTACEGSELDLNDLNVEDFMGLDESKPNKPEAHDGTQLVLNAEDENAYILENGTILEQGGGGYLLYILHQLQDTNN